MTEAAEPAAMLASLRASVLAALRQPLDLTDVMARICRACVQLLPVDGASILIMTDTRQAELLCASDTVIERIEGIQFSLGEGPCFQAFDTGRPILIADLAADAATAWPVFATQTVGEPVGAIFAFPLQHGAARLGTIDLYRRAAGWLRPDDLATTLRIADLAAAALLAFPDTSALNDAAGEGVEAWLAALPPHSEKVHQATGMLIAAHRIGAEQALALLRGYAFSAGRLIDEVAADLVSRRLHPRQIVT